MFRGDGSRAQKLENRWNCLNSFVRGCRMVEVFLVKNVIKDWWVCNNSFCYSAHTMITKKGIKKYTEIENFFPSTVF